jgi:hypothetical protein
MPIDNTHPFAKTSNPFTEANSAGAQPLLSDSFAQPESLQVRENEAELVFRLAAIQIRWQMNYACVLQEIVFSQTLDKFDRKDAKKYSTILKTPDALSLLYIIWKESLTDDQLKSFGVTRLPAPLNAHGLAVQLSETPRNLAQLNSHIRNFSLAAAAYGLLNRASARSKLVVLEPTTFLHEFLVELMRRNLNDPEFRSIISGIANSP